MDTCPVHADRPPVTSGRIRTSSAPANTGLMISKNMEAVIAISMSQGIGMRVKSNGYMYLTEDSRTSFFDGTPTLVVKEILKGADYSSILYLHKGNLSYPSPNDNHQSFPAMRKR